jgi:uncharacterized Zn finger protein
MQSLPIAPELYAKVEGIRMPPSLPSFLTKLSFDILAAWAGETVFQRGLAYHKAGKARDLALTPEGGLLATVAGTQWYTTLLFQNEDGQLESVCTCPYGPQCKHAVALACAGLARDANTPIPPVAAHDKRLRHVAAGGTPLAENPTTQELEAALEQFSKKQLIALVIQAVGLAPEITALCLSGAEPQQQGVLALVQDARNVMHRALEAPDWHDDYYHQAYADYEPVRKKLEALRLAGFLAEVLELGFELIEESMNQIEMSDDEGATHNDVAQCMDIVLQALRDVDWPVQQKLQWAADAVLADAFSVCDCFIGYLREKHSQEAWSPVADTLMGSLAQHQEKGFARKGLTDMTVHALTEAGRSAEVLDLCKHEAVHHGEYLRLVEHLLMHDNDQETEEWIHRGIAVLEQEKPYTAKRLRSCLLDLRKKQNNWDAALCMQTEDFVLNATLRLFQECRYSADRLGVWPALRPLLMDFLIERALPWNQDAWPCQNRGKVSASSDEKHPDFTTLIDLAIDENKPAEVLKWYDLQCETRRGASYSADKVAAAVQDFAPDRAIALWKGLAEAQIALVSARAYEAAAVFLRKMGKLMHRFNMAADWDAYIQSLRAGHRRKTRLMAVLDGLSAVEQRNRAL